MVLTAVGRRWDLLEIQWSLFTTLETVLFEAILRRRTGFSSPAGPPSAAIVSITVTEGHANERVPVIRVTAMPADTNPYGGVFGGWLMGQMGLACGSFASRRTRGKAILVAADGIKFPGAMAVGDELSVYVDLLKQGRTSLRLKAEAIARQRDSDEETVVAEGEFTFVALDAQNNPRPIPATAESDT
jgi:acyl-CoA thioesterase YciA